MFITLLGSFEISNVTSEVSQTMVCGPKVAHLPISSGPLGCTNFHIPFKTIINYVHCLYLLPVPLLFYVKILVVKNLCSPNCLFFLNLAH